MLRQYLSDNGWYINAETVLRDGRFLYTVMEVIWQPKQPKLTVGQRYFSPALLKCTAKELPEYYNQLLFRLRRAIKGKGELADPDMIAALTELEKDSCFTHLKEE